MVEEVGLPPRMARIRRIFASTVSSLTMSELLPLSDGQCDSHLARVVSSTWSEDRILRHCLQTGRNRHGSETGRYLVISMTTSSGSRARGSFFRDNIKERAHLSSALSSSTSVSRLREETVSDIHRVDIDRRTRYLQSQAVLRVDAAGHDGVLFLCGHGGDIKVPVSEQNRG